MILTRKTWACCWNWGRLPGARAAGDTAVRTLRWSHLYSQCPWSSHSNLSRPSLASVLQDTARRRRRERKRKVEIRKSNRGVSASDPISIRQIWGGNYLLHSVQKTRRTLPHNEGQKYHLWDWSQFVRTALQNSWIWFLSIYCIGFNLWSVFLKKEWYLLQH